jgi:hypothetical protein
MKLRVLLLTVVLQMALVFGCNVPPIPCLLADAQGGPAAGGLGNPYLVVYHLRPGSESGCTDDPTVFTGQPHFLYQESYPTTPDQPKDSAWIPDEFAYDETTGEPPDPNRYPTIQGRLTSVSPDQAGLCDVEGTDAGEQEIGGVLITYQLKQVQAVETAGIQGTEILADVVITRGACSREYDALGIWPPVGCSSTMDCDPFPDPQRGWDGSGLSPSLPIECNTDPPLGDGDAGYCFFPQATPEGFPFLLGNSR